MTKRYTNIANYNLNMVLDDVKHILDTKQFVDTDTRFKFEFILEELLVNSFTHLLTSTTKVDVMFELNYDIPKVSYCEVGVPELDFEQILKNGDSQIANPSLDNIGGLGINLIKQLSSQFSYEYDKSAATRKFTILL